ncbi:hypothetical protein X798_07357, partial [Onchocerca flexuosa]
DLSPVPTLSLSPDFLPCEFPDPTHPILSASGTAPSVSSKMEYIANPSLNVLSKSKVNDDASDVKLRLGDPKSNHQIRDIVAEEQQYIQLLGQPTTVQITETGDVVTTSDASLNMHLVETNAQVKLERPNAMQEANFVHTLKVEDSQQLKIGNERSGGSTGTQRCLSQPQVVSSSKACSRYSIAVDSTADPISTALGVNYSVGKLPSGVSLSTDQLNVPAIRTVYEHIPDPMLQNEIAALSEADNLSNRNYYYYGKSTSEKSSPLLENKQLLKHQHSMRSEFKVPLLNPEIKVGTGRKQPSNLSGKTAAKLASDKGAEKTIIEIRRPLSYPESNSKQTNIQQAGAVSSFRSGSSPPQPTQLFSRYGAVVTTQGIENVQQQEQSGNVTRDQLQKQNRTRLITDRNREQNKVILKKNITKQKKDKIGDQNGGFFHQFTPTTSKKRREAQL